MFYWILAIAIFAMLILMVGEFYIFYRDRRSSALFAALSYLIIGIGLAFYFSTSSTHLWLWYVIGPSVFLFAIIIYWVSFNARKEEHAPRPIFITKSQKEKEANKQAKLDKKRTAEFSASGAIAAEKRDTARTTSGPKPGRTGDVPRAGRK
jgi:amino acid transporter